ncbi:uncharacterized protein LOC112056559 [Bicyclus anynana]|uniref:Uncharacterized protein LOC112056559 n=1 Tax=Bicyclus anynana TaxID=110368 RepID=A0ABM3LMV7_BICAN|nr:uncharacterized protein LOC112056559 [Bicyclus anynana]
MEDIANSSIEKIRLEEIEKQTKLREKREMENKISSLNKAIRDATAQSEKLELEREQLIKVTDALRKQKLLEECRRDTLSAQFNSLKDELKQLRAKSVSNHLHNKMVSEVWEMRSEFCKEIYATSDACDIQTLLMKPGCTKPVYRNIHKKEHNVPTSSESETRLQKAIERRKKSLAERDRLLIEPDAGEEFLR